MQERYEHNGPHLAKDCENDRGLDSLTYKETERQLQALRRGQI